MKSISAAEFIVLKDLTDSYNHLEQILRQLIPECNVEKWSNVYRKSWTEVSKSNWNTIVVQQQIDEFNGIGPFCAEAGISLNNLFISERREGEQITLGVGAFLEICNLRKKLNSTWQEVSSWLAMRKKLNSTWQEVSSWLDNLLNMRCTADVIRKKFDSLSEIKRKQSKNKETHELQILLMSPVCFKSESNVRVQELVKLNQDTSNRDGLKKKLEHVEFHNANLTEQNNLPNEIIQDNTLETSQLRNETRLLTIDNKSLKIKCKQIEQIECEE